MTHQCDARRKGDKQRCKQPGTHFSPRSKKWTCRFHGGAKGSGAPRGEKNGAFVHGARAGGRSGIIEPMNETEEQLLAGYLGMERLDTAKDARAKQALLHHRAFLHAMRTGDNAGALRATQALVSVLDIEHRIEKGFVVHHSIDERAIGLLVGVVVGVLRAQIKDPELLAAVINELGATDWAQVTVPQLTETVPATAERA